jgi:hypothetical protein
VGYLEEPPAGAMGEVRAGSGSKLERACQGPEMQATASPWDKPKIRKVDGMDE